MNKQQIRDQQLAARQALSQLQIEAQSQAICNQSLALIQQQKAKYIHLFLPIAEKKEVNSYPLYGWLIESEEHTPIISKTHWTQRQLSHHPMTAEDELQVSKLGIPEPLHSWEIAIEKIELIFVPLLAFDAMGNRLGYGAGLYDRFLAACPDALKVGLSLLPMHHESLPKEEHDVLLDLCITPEGISDFRNY